MKLRYFLFIVFSLLFVFYKVDAEIINDYNIAVGDVYSNEDVIDSIDGIMGTWNDFSYNLAYVDEDDRLLQAYTVTNRTNGAGYHLWEEPDARIGATCKETYKQYLSSSYEKQCEKYNIYSGKDISNITYWEVVSVNDISLERFCDIYVFVSKTNPCVNYDLTYSSVIILRKFIPATFELLCNPKEVKKGEIVNCELKINSKSPITNITIPKEDELYDIIEYIEGDGWTLVDSEEDIITIKADDVFNGEGVVLELILSLNNDLVDNVNIELDDIVYINSEGDEFDSNAIGDVNIQLEDELEKNDSIEENDSLDEVGEEYNPETNDISLYFIIIGFLTAILLIITVLVNIKKYV